MQTKLLLDGIEEGAGSEVYYARRGRGGRDTSTYSSSDKAESRGCTISVHLEMFRSIQDGRLSGLAAQRRYCVQRIRGVGRDG